MSIDENALMKNEIETDEMIALVHRLTGVSIDNKDPMLALFLFHHRYLEDFYSQQSELDNKNAQEVHTALSPLIDDLNKTVVLIDEKDKVLKQDIAVLQSFKEELLTLITVRSEELAQKNVGKEIKQQVSGSLNKLGETVANSLNTLNGKNNYLLFGVFALQFIAVILLLFMVLK